MTLRFLTMPPSTNHLYGAGRGGSRFLKPEVRDAKEAIGWEARSQYQGKPLTGPLTAEVRLYWPTRANHDVDNIKALLDALSGVVYVDDGQIQQLLIVKAVDKENPRVEMSVSDFEG